MPETNTEKKKGGAAGVIALFLKFSIGSWFSAALSFFTTPVVTALIVPDEFGRSSMFNLAYSFCLQIVLLGADQSFVRKFYDKGYEEKRGLLLQNCMLPALGIGAIVSLVTLIFWRSISMLLIQQEQFEICVLLAITVMVGILERYAVLVVRMYKKGLLFSMLRVVGSVVTFLVIVLYCHYVNHTMYAILYSIMIPLSVTAAIAIFIERKLWFNRFGIDRETVRSVIRYGIPFIPTFLAYWVFEGIDKIALRNYSTFHEIGLFAAASKIVALLSILQISFSTFWAPVAYEAYEKQSDESKAVFKKTFSYLSVTLFVAGLLVTAGRDVIMLFFASSYNEAGQIMPFLLLIPIMYTMSEITVGGINFKNQTHWHFTITIIVALANITGNFFLVPRLGAKGAAISTGLSYIIFFYCRTYFSHRLFPVDFGLKRVTLSIIVFVINAYIHSFYGFSWWNAGVTAFFVLFLLYLYRLELRLLYDITLGKLKFA